MTNGLDHSEAYIILPVSPACIFIAVNTPEMVRRISETDAHTLVKEINAKVVGQAIRYVYDTNDAQLRFVENRLRRSPSPLGRTKSHRRSQGATSDEAVPL